MADPLLEFLSKVDSIEEKWNQGGKGPAGRADDETGWKVEEYKCPGGEGVAARGTSGQSFRKVFTKMEVGTVLRRWEDACFDTNLNRAIQAAGLGDPTPIQARAIPAILAGRDVIGVASTGSGKTFAFLFPLIVHVLDQRAVDRNSGPIALVVCPTREIAHQQCRVTNRYFRPQGAKACGVMGGKSRWEQQQALKDPYEAVIGTPGMLIDMIKRKALKMKRVTYVVLDEADRMLETGFEAQVDEILGKVRPDKQMMLFSATFAPSRGVQRIVHKFMCDPILISRGDISKGSTNADIEQIPVILNNAQAKYNWLVKFLQEHKLDKVLVFTGEREDCEKLTAALSPDIAGLWIQCVHGEKHHVDRHNAILEFRKRDKGVLVTTNIVARGLDIPDIKYVVCYDPSKSVDSHIHRIGRTSRMNGLNGVCYSLVLGTQYKFAQVVLKTMEASGTDVPPELREISTKGDKQNKSLVHGMFRRSSETLRGSSLPSSSDEGSNLVSLLLSREERNALKYTHDQLQGQYKKSRWDQQAPSS
uniref:RNA helicase n=1 Tax=Mucochytrium quahogii TaxID=96639 RepID=A0A7S2WAI1_9STRA|mmetsp:Transcript_6668/g.10503  ORF Transcript_6668/g.10503 Transcript_6668/m.10503 type:complete len:532 (+) Transcript_6668:115-1710(+)